MTVRQIVLDTETTGLDAEQGHRIIEIGCVELINRRNTGNNYQQYLNPDRQIDEGAFAVHGISNEMLQDKPRFGDIVEDFIDFVRGAELIIHNADFDIDFLDHELERVGPHLGSMQDHCTILDTLQLARQTHPGQRNDLDALCRRYEIDNSQRTLHGALLDAEILADVYRAMTGGQTALFLDSADGTGATAADAEARRRRRPTGLKVIRATEAELAEHRAWLERLEHANGRCLWRHLDEKTGPAPGSRPR